MKSTDEILQELKESLAHHEKEAVRLRTMIAAAEGTGTVAVAVPCLKGKASICCCPTCLGERILTAPLVGPFIIPIPAPTAPVSTWPWDITITCDVGTTVTSTSS